MSDDMAERVGRAMAENAGFCWENCAQSQWESDARAGIKAMREPTEAMLHAARDWSIKKYHRGIGDEAAIGCWQAMIDATRKG